MSVLIKGMEMPKSCIECVINHSFFRVLKCSELKGMKGFKKLPYEHDRHPDCPLSALPDKHGRLIDADAFIEHLEKEFADGYEKDQRSDAVMKMLITKMNELIITEMRKRPTVIESEE